MLSKLLLLRLTVFVLSLLLSGYNSAAYEDVLPQNSLKKIVFSCQLTEENLFYKQLNQRYSDAFSRLGYQFRMEHQPNVRSVHSANSGVVDGNCFRVSDFVDNTKYKNLIRVDYVVGELSFDIWRLNNGQTKPYTNLIHPHHKIGYTRGANIIKRQLESNNKSNPITPINETISGFQMLILGRIDIYIEHSYKAENAFKQLPIEERALVINSGSYLMVNVYPYLNKQHRHLSKPLAKALHSLESMPLPITDSDK